MSDAHVALVVEDDPQIAEILVELVRSLGHTARHAMTLLDVRAAIADGGYCYVLLDMQIPADPQARPLVASGETALELLRRRDPGRSASDGHVLPVLVVTSYSKEPEFVTRMYDAGADGFIAKPFGADPSVVLDRIRWCLGRAARADHAACELLAAAAATSRSARPPEPPVASAGAAAPTSAIVARLAVDGSRQGRRAVVHVNGGRVELQDAHFYALLRLVAARLWGDGWCTLRELGAAKARAVPSRLRRALAASVPADVELVESDWGGRFRLSASVEIEDVAWTKLLDHPDARIQTLARSARR